MENDEKPTEVVTTPPDPPVEHTPPPVTEPDEAKDTTKDLLKELSEKVASLEQTVSELVPAQERDTVPTKQPWTHKRLF
jgi:hypothetical protein